LSPGRKLVVVRPTFRCGQVGCNSVFLADGVVSDFAALANAQIWLDMRAG